MARRRHGGHVQDRFGTGADDAGIGVAGAGEGVGVGEDVLHGVHAGVGLPGVALAKGEGAVAAHEQPTELGLAHGPQLVEGDLVERGGLERH